MTEESASQRCQQRKWISSNAAVIMCACNRPYNNVSLRSGICSAGGRPYCIRGLALSS